MKRSEVNTCQDRARKRATSDFRCAVRKLVAEATDAGRADEAARIESAAAEIIDAVEAVRA